MRMRRAWGIKERNFRVRRTREWRATLMQLRSIPRDTGGEMSAKRLAFLLLSLFVASSFAQVNELAVTVGRTFISTQTIQNDGTSINPRIHFGTEESFAFDYARYLTTRGVFGFSAELPVAIVPRIDLNTFLNQVPKDIGALF